MNPLFNFLAMAGQQSKGGSQPSGIGTMGMMVLFFLIMYVMLIRPQQRKEKERRAMLAELKKGDKVLFAGGLIGTIAVINDKTAKVKVADNVRLDVARGAITAIITADADLETAPPA